MSDVSSRPLWSPTGEQIAAANMTAFSQAAEKRWGRTFPDYAALHRWSVDEPEQFWESLWRFCGVVASKEWDTVVEGFDRLPGARWFPGARLNFAENLLRRRDDQPAIVAWNEAGPRSTLTWSELAAQVAAVAESLRRSGIRAGDRIAAFVPNIPEVAVAMLAATSLGAVWSSCSPDFGVSGVLDRFGQIEPRILFAADGCVYAGKQFDVRERIRGICAAIPSIERVVVIPNLSERPPLDGIPGAVAWQEFAQPTTAELTFEQLPFDHPLYVLFSSGTTGPPKCILHTVGGVLLQHLKEHQLHIDLRRDDRIFYFTTCGWMMWNWLVTSLASESTMLVYDGSPLAPKAEVLFDFIERERITIFGTSPKYLAAIEKAGLEPARTHDLSSLRVVISTGAPLGVSGFDYVYQKIRPDVRLSGISGGTDLCASFVSGNPLLPVYRGEMQSLGLGMRTDVFDDDGNSIRCAKGELVCTAPFPSLPIGFLGDVGDVKYKQTYFERYPGVWWHGDYAEITEHGGMIIYGRSDAVLNPGGVRIGTAEIYRQIEQLGDVLESVVVGQDWAGDVRVVLFVKLRDGATLDDALCSKIKDQIRRHTTPRHVPSKIIAVADIPHTKSGKIVELAVRDVIHGRPVRNADALANPEALSLYQDLPELAC